MDPQIWGQLPAELLDHILAFLPLKTFFNLRSTCKHFKSLIFSPSFTSKHSPSSSSSSPFSSFLLLSHPQCYSHFPLYDSVLGTWRNLTLPLSGLLPCASPRASLLSISNGLLCFSLPSSASFIVCNILAKSSRLIQFPIYPLTFEFLSLVSTPFGYNIFMLCSGSSSSNTYFVYDSKVQSWQRFEGLNRIISDNYNQEGVYFDGSLYLTTSEPFSVVCFNLESGKWEVTKCELPNELTFIRLVSNGKGKLYLIGGIGRNGISRGMKLWKLDEEMKWVEIERLPELMCRKFMTVCYHNYEHVYCFCHEGMICICCYTWPEILYYKLSRRTWHWLPKCPSLPDKCSFGFSYSFVFERRRQGLKRRAVAGGSSAGVDTEARGCYNGR